MFKLPKHLLTLFAGILIVFTSCAAPEVDTENVTIDAITAHPEWSKDASIYEVNIRQYSEEGTFNAFREDLPRLEAMGVDILWLMPIHPIGEENRKGPLGRSSRK